MAGQSLKEQIARIHAETDAAYKSFDANVFAAGEDPEGGNESVTAMAATRAARELILIRGELRAMRLIWEQAPRGTDGLPRIE